MRRIAAIVGFLMLLEGALLAPAALAPAAVAAAGRPATLDVRARMLESGRILLEVTSDARSVLVVWRTAAGSSQAAIMLPRAGRVAGLVPKGSTKITAKARATASRRESATIKVRVAPVRKPPKPLKTSKASTTAKASKPTTSKTSVRKPSDNTVVPASSGTGRRIIWSKSRNRVWLMSGDRSVARTFPVTDRDDLTPVGTYRVQGSRPVSYSIDEHGRAWRLDHFVRFRKRCAACAWIGFHAIPVSGAGKLIQPVSDLGTNRHTSHGCLRLESADARYLYGFAGPGTKVVVVA